MKFLFTTLILFTFMLIDHQIKGGFSEEKSEEIELEISEKEEKEEKEINSFEYDFDHIFDDSFFKFKNKDAVYSYKLTTVTTVLIFMIKSFHYPNAPPV